MDDSSLLVALVRKRVSTHERLLLLENEGGVRVEIFHWKVSAARLERRAWLRRAGQTAFQGRWNGHQRVNQKAESSRWSRLVDDQKQGELTGA